MIIENARARSFVAIMIVIAVSALFLRIAIEKIININIRQNEANAALTLKFISAALENYAKDNKGFFPTEPSSLTKTTPPYLDKDYITQSPLKGYNFSCTRLEASGYSCSAAPVKCGLTGNLIHAVTSGGLLISEECSKKD